jgi:hypothetical protein
MVDDRKVMYDGFSDKGAHSMEWVHITQDFLNLAFFVGRRAMKSLRKKFQN